MDFEPSPTVRFTGFDSEEPNNLGATANASEEIVNVSGRQTVAPEIDLVQIANDEDFAYSPELHFEGSVSEEIFAASAGEQFAAMPSVRFEADAEESIIARDAFQKADSLKAITSIQGLWRGRQSRKSLKVSNLHIKDLATAHAAKLRAIYASCRRKIAITEKPKTLRDVVLLLMRGIREVSWTSSFVDNVNYHGLWANIWGIICKAWACEPDDIRVMLVLEKQLKDVLHAFPKKNSCTRQLEDMRSEIDKLLNLCTAAKKAHHDARRCQYEEYVNMLERELGELTRLAETNELDAAKEAEIMQLKLEALLELTDEVFELHSGENYFDKKRFKGLKKQLKALLKHLGAMNFDDMDAEKGAKELIRCRMKAGAAFDLIRKAHKSGKDQCQINAERKQATEACDKLHDALRKVFAKKPQADQICVARSTCVLDRLGMWHVGIVDRLVAPEFIELEEEVQEEEETPAVRASVRPTVRQTCLRKTVIEGPKFEAEAPEYGQCDWGADDVNLHSSILTGEEQPKEDDDAPGLDDDDHAYHEDSGLGEDLRNAFRHSVDMVLGLDEGSCTFAENESQDGTLGVPTTAGTGERPMESRSTGFGDIEFVDPDPETQSLHDEQDKEPSLQELWHEQGWTPVDQRDNRWSRWRHQSMIWQSRVMDSDDWFLNCSTGLSTTPSEASRTGKGFDRSYNRGGIPGWRGSCTLNVDLDPKPKDACDPSGPARGPKLLRESRSAGGLPHPSKAKGSHSRLYQQDADASPLMFAAKLCGSQLIRGTSAARLVLSHCLSEAPPKPNHPKSTALHLRARMHMTLGDDGGRLSSWMREKQRSMPRYSTAEATKALSEACGSKSLPGRPETPEVQQLRSLHRGHTNHALRRQQMPYRQFVEDIAS